jgi:hypothetical protein
MPWLTVHTHVTPEDAVIYEQMLDELAQADKQAKLNAAFSPSNLDRSFIEEGWPHWSHDATPRADHHD